MPAKRTREIRDFLINQISIGNGDAVRQTQEKFAISRQAVNRHLRNLVAEGILKAEGNTRQRSYQLTPGQANSFRLAITPELREDEVWRNNIRPLLDGVPDNVLRICNFGFTEILNNVVDHSEGSSVFIQATRTAAGIEITIHDNGIGIFRKIKRDLNLEDERYAILELAKGKLTTAPNLHTGEGIFFTSRSFDIFTISSGSLFFSHASQGPGQDWLLEDHPGQVPGTLVSMQISLASQDQLKEIFDRFTADAEDYGFSRTIVPVILARFGDENLLSRSQAKRLLARFERFREVLLDFAGVEFIGQAFADEVFRIFRSQHPEVNLTWMNTVPGVESTIIGASAAR